MTQKQHLPLTKPPQAAEKQQDNSVAVLPKITQQRMTTLNRWNKLFAVLGLFFLSLGLFFYLQWDKDRKALAKYEKVFEQFYQGSALTITNNSEVDLEITKLNITYIDLDKDSIIYKEMLEGAGIIPIKSNGNFELGDLEDKILEKNIQILSCGILGWKNEEIELEQFFWTDKLPKTGRILL